MNVKALISVAVLPLTAGIIMANPSSANAAKITGPGEINFAFELDVQFDSGDGDITTPGDNSFTIDFSGTSMPANPAVLAVLGPNSAKDGFSEFGVGATVISPNIDLTADIQIPAAGGTGFDVPFNNFITLLDPAAGGDSALDPNPDVFNLENIGLIQLSPSLDGDGNVVGTDASLGVTGTWINEDGEELDGVGVYTFQFAGLDANQTEALLLNTETNGPFTISGSANFIAGQDIPEPGTISGLAVLVSTFGFLKRRKLAH